MSTTVLQSLRNNMPTPPIGFVGSISDIRRLVGEMRPGAVTPTPGVAMMSLIDLLKRLEATQFRSYESVSEAAVMLAYMAFMTSKTWTAELHEGRVDKLVETILDAKNADYGHAYAKYGVDGIIVRVWDKILRWINLQDKTAKTESLEDTSVDMAGYFFLMYAYAEGKMQERKP